MSDTTSTRLAQRKQATLAALVLAVAVTWLVVLPWIQSLPAVQSRIELHERHRIDPSAMFYTELEMFDSRQDAKRCLKNDVCD